MSRMSKNTRTLFFTTSVLALTALMVGGCNDDEDETQAACERSYGKGACEIAPEDQAKPVLMTEQNRPSYEEKQKCEAQYGAGHCETQSVASGGHVVYWPYFMPGQTYYYPHTGGYYAGSFTERPSWTARNFTAAPRYTPSAVTIARGGFGSTGGRAFGGGG